MMSQFIRFEFEPRVPMREVEGTFRLAQLAAESLVGVDRMRLEAKFTLDREARTIVVDTNGRLGRMLALIFSGYARREFGRGAMNVQHIGVPRPELAALGNSGGEDGVRGQPLRGGLDR